MRALQAELAGLETEHTEARENTAELAHQFLACKAEALESGALEGRLTEVVLLVLLLIVMFTWYIYIGTNAAFDMYIHYIHIYVYTLHMCIMCIYIYIYGSEQH